MNAGKSTTSTRQIASMPSSAIFQRLDLLDAVLGEVRRRAADRRRIEPAVFLARLAHWEERLPFATITIEPPASGRRRRTNPSAPPWSDRTRRGIAVRRLGGTGVVHRMVLQIIRAAPRPSPAVRATWRARGRAPRSSGRDSDSRVLIG